MSKAVILTALQIEFVAVRAHLSHVTEQVHPLGTVYECGMFEANGREWNVAVADVGMGNQRAAVETERALSHFKPDVAMFVGVARGLKDVSLGDVVAATKVYAYEYGKAAEEFHPRPEVGLASYRLEQRAKQVARDNDWQARIISPTEGSVPRSLHQIEHQHLSFCVEIIVMQPLWKWRDMAF